MHGFRDKDRGYTFQLKHTLAHTVWDVRDAAGSSSCRAQQK